MLLYLCLSIPGANGSRLLMPHLLNEKILKALQYTEESLGASTVPMSTTTGAGIPGNGREQD